MGCRHLVARLGQPILVIALCLAMPAFASDLSPVSDQREIARRPFGHGRLRLIADRDGTGRLLYADAATPEKVIPCDVLSGASGLWIADVDGDGSPEIVVTLRKPAKFDPVVENRLHVYTIEDGQCVPVWRGTRLAGRFERIHVDGARLVALERSGSGWRIARYQWHGFGYVVEQILWEGRRRPRARWMAMFREGNEK